VDELRAIATELGWIDEFNDDWEAGAWGPCESDEHMTVRLMDCETLEEVNAALVQMRVGLKTVNMAISDSVTLTMAQWAHCHLGTPADSNRQICSLDY
jgi:hypothetical protein